MTCCARCARRHPNIVQRLEACPPLIPLELEEKRLAVLRLDKSNEFSVSKPFPRDRQAALP